MSRVQAPLLTPKKPPGIVEESAEQARATARVGNRFGSTPGNRAAEAAPGARLATLATLAAGLAVALDGGDLDGARLVHGVIGRLLGAEGAEEPSASTSASTAPSSSSSSDSGGEGSRVDPGELEQHLDGKASTPGPELTGADLGSSLFGPGEDEQGRGEKVVRLDAARRRRGKGGRA